MYRLDIPNMIYRVGIRIPHLDINGKYDIDARVFVVPVKGVGKIYLNASKLLKSLKKVY